MKSLIILLSMIGNISYAQDICSSRESIETTYFELSEKVMADKSVLDAFLASDLDLSVLYNCPQPIFSHGDGYCSTRFATIEQVISSTADEAQLIKLRERKS